MVAACLYQTIVTKVPVKQLFGMELLYICRKHELIKIVNADYSKLHNSMFTSCQPV